MVFCLLLPLGMGEEVVEIGEFSNLQHRIKGTVFVKEPSTIIISGFNYDGEGPDGDSNIFFYAVNSSYPYSPEDVARGYSGSAGFKVILPYPFEGVFYSYDDPNIPDLRKHFQDLKEKQGSDRGKSINFLSFFLSFSSIVTWEDTMELTLPPGLEVDQITFLSVWCRKLGINFGIVEFPLKKQLYD